MMTKEQFRAMALSFPQAVEAGHFDVVDFRVRGKIFATLRDADGRAVLKLSPGDQALYVETSPESFRPVAGAWGAKGWTLALLDSADPASVRQAMTMAWKLVAPKKLAATSGF